nr:deoxyribonuclease TatD [uncultured bacterium]
MDLIDIGVNFHTSQLAGHTSDILARAREAGLVSVMATGTSHKSSVQALHLARAERGFVFATAGVHPHSADNWSPSDLERFALLWESPEVVAIGECGLDYNRNFSSRENQRKAFSAQLRAAAAFKKPLFLHCRDAFEEFHALVTEPGVGAVRGVVHCFTGTYDEAQAFLAMGLDIGITGWVTDLNRGGALREAVKGIPLERLHLETDAPYLSPKNLKRRRTYNEPANLRWVAHEVALLKGLPLEEVARRCTENSGRLFSLKTTRPEMR